MFEPSQPLSEQTRSAETDPSPSPRMNFLRLAHRLETLAIEVTPWLRQQSGAPEGVETKPDGSQVTACDKEMERRFRLACKEGLGVPFAFLGEESEEIRQTPLSEITDFDYVAICDPIDGTANFIAGNGLYGCLLGIYRRTSEGVYQPSFGAVLLPESGHLYITEGDDVLDLN
ncbi:MAG: hypothetical protein KDD64_17465, partial [Bdellovibrionales bacterium]|nr:hypothetical protein [Bdellovibrionales bacterium]